MEEKIKKLFEEINFLMWKETGNRHWLLEENHQRVLCHLIKRIKANEGQKIRAGYTAVAKESETSSSNARRIAVKLCRFGMITVESVRDRNAQGTAISISQYDVNPRILDYLGDQEDRQTLASDFIKKAKRRLLEKEELQGFKKADFLFGERGPR
jgi:hypothetical protein